MSGGKAPAYTSQGFHARIRMAKDFSLFIVTEGTEGDPYFYHSLARSSAKDQVRASKIFPAESVTRKDSMSPGTPGKAGVILAFNAAADAGTLSLGSGDEKRSVLFCVDRDIDEKHAPYVSSPHFLVTTARDVEAEIFGNADLTKAIAQLASKDFVEAAAIAKKARHWQKVLYTAWREWILFGAIAAGMETRSAVTWGGKSLINGDFGTVDPQLRMDFEARLVADAGTKRKFADLKRSAKSRIAANRAAAPYMAVIKGKWVPEFLEFYLRPLCSSPLPKKNRIRTNALSAFAGAVNYDAPWAKPYRDRMEQLF